jgi:hypothetical protein
MGFDETSRAADSPPEQMEQAPSCSPSGGGSGHLSGSNLRFRHYLLENVYLRTTEAQRLEILALWHDGGVDFEATVAERHCRETVFLVRTSSGQLAGVSEVALVRVKNHRRFYSCTMFLGTRARVPYLSLKVLNATRDFLRSFQHPKSQPAGMLIVTENRKLMRPGMRRLLTRHGYQHWGMSARDEDVWAVEFSEPQENQPSRGKPLVVSAFGTS